MKITQYHRRQKGSVENTIPLINIVFLMLIFFLLAGTVAAPLSSDIQIPETRDLAQTPPAENVIQVLVSGQFLYKGNSVTQESLFLKLQELIPAGSQVAQVKGLAILADKHLPAQKLSSLLSELRRAGYRKVRLVTRHHTG